MKNFTLVRVALLVCFVALPLKGFADTNEQTFAKLAALDELKLKPEKIADSEYGMLIREIRSSFFGLDQTQCEQIREARSNKIILTICETISHPELRDN